MYRRRALRQDEIPPVDVHRPALVDRRRKVLSATSGGTPTAAAISSAVAIFLRCEPFRTRNVSSSTCGGHSRRASSRVTCDAAARSVDARARRTVLYFQKYFDRFRLTLSGNGR